MNDDKTAHSDYCHLDPDEQGVMNRTSSRYTNQVQGLCDVSPGMRSRKSATDQAGWDPAHFKPKPDLQPPKTALCIIMFHHPATSETSCTHNL